VITGAQLRAIAGYAFARGKAYLEEGRVLECNVADDTTIDGRVEGETVYLVRVVAAPGFLVGECTCPVGGPMCKHAVALVLYHLERTAGQPTLARTPLARSEWSKSNADAFTTRQDLEAWAKTNNVPHVLDVAADVLCDELPTELVARYGLKYVLGRLALRDVASRDGSARYLNARGGVEALVAEAAHRVLVRGAGSVLAGMVEEDTRVAPVEPSLLALWTKLRGVRREHRAGASPRSRDDRARGVWAFEKGGPTIIWKEPERLVKGGFGGYGHLLVATKLKMIAGEPRFQCTCRPGDRDGAGTCTHVLALIDATLDRLELPEHAAEMRPIADEIMRPGWSRALEALDTFDTAITRPRVVEVWWRVEPELGAISLTPIVKKQTKRGGMTAGAKISAARLLEEYRDELSDEDRTIAEHVAAWVPASRAAGTYPVRGFAALVGHPRVVLEGSDTPVSVSRVPLGFSALAAGDAIRVEPSLEGERMSPRMLEPLLKLFPSGEPIVLPDPDRQRLMLVDATDDARKLFGVLEAHGDAFPPEAHATLLERLGRIESRLPITVPSAFKGKQLASQATVVVRMRLAMPAGLECELFVRPGPGAPLFPPGVGPKDVMLANVDGERAYVRRELATENEYARAMLQRLPMDGAEEGPPGVFRIVDLDAALGVVAAAQTPPPGLEAEWLEQKPTVLHAASAEQLRVQIERKRDWFGIIGDLKVEAGRIELAVLLDAARRQQKYVRLDQERWVELSSTLRDRLLAIADRTFVDAKQRIELSPGAVPAIEALGEAGAEVSAAPEWQLLAERLAASLLMKPVPPATLKATLRDYQLDGHAWLSRVAAWGAGAVLADDMGLGKTVQAIAVMLDRAKQGPTLVLAPTSVALNWVAELERFAPTLKPIVYALVEDRAKALAKVKKADVVIASYGLLVRDAELLAKTKFGTLVIDEAQALKNPTTQRAKAARGLDAGFRIALSGTPFENHLGELWSLFAIVFPGLLGSWEQFRERFANPIERSKDEASRAALSRVLQPFLLRRTKAEVAKELPPRTEITVPVALSADEMAMYEDARLAAVAELGSSKVKDEQKRFQILAALTRLRLMASHPRLHDPKSTLGSSKMMRLLELLDELRSEGHRALVFSQFTSHLALVREELDRAGYVSLYLDGSTALGQRAKLVERFQNGEGEVFLISLKAGGTGINLTAADYVIHLDPWWNPAVEDQASDRAHRIGQTKPVTVFRLVARGTIEEQIVGMHEDKRALVAGILEGTDIAGRLTTRDLLAMLERGDRVVADDGDGPPSIH